MPYLTDAAAQVVVPLCWLCVILLAGWLHEYLCDIYYGITPAPRWMTRRYWRRVFVRVICRLAELEVAWERKIPRKVAASRGMVGQRIRWSDCEISKIIAYPTLDVKGDCPIRVEWRWMRR